MDGEGGERVDELARELKQAQHLLRVVCELSRVTDMAGVVAVVRRAARELAAADGATFVLAEGDEVHYVEEDAIAPLWKGRRFPVSECISGWVMVHRQPVAIEDIRTDPRIPASAYAPTFVKSLAMVPIGRDEPVGALGVYWAVPKQADAGTLRGLSLLAESTAAAFERARLLEAERTARTDAESRETALGEQLRQAQKMEAIGRLAGGIAHDFNNVLSVVIVHASLMEESVHERDPLRVHVTEILEATTRATELTRQVLAVSRQQVMHPRAMDLVAQVRSLESMLRRVLGEDVELVVETRDEPASVFADPVQIDQVILNLAVNARDAMPNGGRLTMEIAPVTVTASDAPAKMGSRPGRYVRLTVADNGAGMDEATKARAFEPFFTTKPKGTGTGLGLATVFGIVQQSKGHISLASEQGVGTRFDILLPWTKAAEDASRVPASNEDEPASLRGSETVLLVEDDRQVRGVAHAVLRKLGYEVLAAANAGEALLIAEQHERPIHLLLADVVLPRMSGRKLADRLAALRPEMKLLMMSGYAEEDERANDGHGRVVPVLQKPLTPRRLARCVRTVLDGTSTLRPAPPA